MISKYIRERNTIRLLIITGISAMLSCGFVSHASAKKHHKVTTDSISSDSISKPNTALSQSSTTSDDAGKILGMSFLGFLFLLWVVPSLVPAIIANSKGRSGIGVFILSIFFSPIIGLIVALIMQKTNKQSSD